MKVLFITEKWCDANPELGLTNSFHNIFGSYHRSKISKEHIYNTIHFDECYINKNIHINNLKELIWDKVRPDIIICTLLGHSNLNPDKNFFEYFKSKGTKISFIFPDISKHWGIKEIHELYDVADKFFSWAHEKNLELDKLEWLWTPEDPSLYYYQKDEEKTIDVSFIGTIHNLERMNYLNFLSNNGINVFVSGGQRIAKLSAEMYASYTRKSKIIINFPTSPQGGIQLKGRIFEATASGCLLMEKENNLISKFFNKDEYVTYTSEIDLLKKCKFYLDNHQERTKISLNGLKKFNEKYSNDVYWDIFFAKLLNKE